MTERPNYYSIIPADVRYDTELKANEKLLYGEITALSNHKGYCFAENSYFAKLYVVKKGTVSGWISNLEDKGYIKTELIYGSNKQVKERRIYLSHTLYDKNHTPPTIKNAHPMREKSQEELNITSTNITSINNDNDNRPDSELINPEIQKPKEQEPKPKDSKLVHRFYQENINAMETPFIAQELEYWVEDLSVELVLEALSRAVKYNAEYGYAERIMKEWAKKNIDTLDKVKQADAAFEQKNNKRYNNSYSKPKREEKIPEVLKNLNDAKEAASSAGDANRDESSGIDASERLQIMRTRLQSSSTEGETDASTS